MKCLQNFTLRVKFPTGSFPTWGHCRVIPTKVILCVPFCAFSIQRGNVRVGSAKEGSSLCLPPFCCVFPALCMNTAPFISTSEISKTGIQGNAAERHRQGQSLGAALGSMQALPEGSIDFHMPQAIKQPPNPLRQRKSSAVYMTASHRNHAEQQARPGFAPHPHPKTCSEQVFDCWCRAWAPRCHFRDAGKHPAGGKQRSQAWNGLLGKRRLLPHVHHVLGFI